MKMKYPFLTLFKLSFILLNTGNMVKSQPLLHLQKKTIADTMLSLQQKPIVAQPQKPFDLYKIPFADAQIHSMMKFIH